MPAPIDITVIRDGGGKKGDDIFEPMLATEALAKQRGKAELNEQAQPNSNRELTFPYTSGLIMGAVYKVIDSLQGKVYTGKLVDIRHSVRMEPPESITVIQLEVPEFEAF